MDQFCPPGTHHFVQGGGAGRLCRVCAKRERIDERTCLFCQTAGEVEMTLLFRGAIEFPGRLCGPCFNEFEDRGTIRDWKVRLAG